MNNFLVRLNRVGIFLASLASIACMCLSVFFFSSYVHKVYFNRQEGIVIIKAESGKFYEIPQETFYRELRSKGYAMASENEILEYDKKSAGEEIDLGTVYFFISLGIILGYAVFSSGVSYLLGTGFKIIIKEKK